MRSRSWRPIPSGQAAVEAMLALTLAGALMHAVVVVGALWLRGQQAAQASRVAVFASALGVSNAAVVGDRSHVVVGRMSSSEGQSWATYGQRNHHAGDGSGRINAHERRDGHVDAPFHIGNVHAVNLARDWLHVDDRLRRATATVYPTPASALTAHDEPASLLSVRRATVIAGDAGHGINETTVSRRIQSSSTGWSRVAKRSMRAAQIVGRRMEPIDLPWGRTAGSIDWLNGWSHVGPTPMQSSRPADSARK